MKTVKMSRKEMKIIMAGSGEITCTRYNGSTVDSFSSDCVECMGAWAGFWNSAGWGVSCSNGYSNGRIFN
ncbi:MAG: hypothetical protein ACK5KP_01465 [Paludibacteraceae bacterium]